MQAELEPAGEQVPVEQLEPAAPAEGWLGEPLRGSEHLVAVDVP